VFVKKLNDLSTLSIFNQIVDYVSKSKFLKSEIFF